MNSSLGLISPRPRCKQCPKCGKRLRKDAGFCGGCGAAIASDDTAASEPEEEVFGPDVVDCIVHPESAADAATDDASHSAFPVEEPHDVSPAALAKAVERAAPRNTKAVCFRVLNGLRAGEFVEVKEGMSVMVGVSKDVDLFVGGDDQVSRRHAQVRVKNGQAFLEDLGSTNGTLIDVKRERPVFAGDRIILGNTVIQVEDCEDGTLAE